MNAMQTVFMKHCQQCGVAEKINSSMILWLSAIIYTHPKYIAIFDIDF